MSWGYKEIYDGNLNRPNGCVLEHRLVAGEMLGRPLEDREVVHHIDKDRSNNNKDNLMVFESNSDHAR